MAKIHIGKKIREVLDRSHFTVVDFAKRINLTRDGVYKIFDKESVAADQLQKISLVLNHDFFVYYQEGLRSAAEKKPAYGYAAKEDVDALSKLVHSLAREIERLREELPAVTHNKTRKIKEQPLK